ncbi:glycosyltransferase family 2 protein [Jeotgalibaca ciconiae]|uniref:Glycosyltransferase n=1 Tax=Jeotgalibaca ciconiae TaxID=2496265 RepID=A0A3S9HC25_9LACT|nr:glycosyltransferase family 2 protein [Jeotgalibaca ciconiae]AZP04918.1 glycosyltransferase [Jeotgalibaca ciconiae]
MVNNRMVVNVVTPFYDGNKYLDDYAHSMSKAIENATQMNKNISFIITIVNDSPHIEIDQTALQGLEKNTCQLSIITNEKNSGIHQSRVNGIQSCESDYTVMLDQDDLIGERFFTNITKMKDTSDVLLMNGFYETAIAKEPIYNNDLTMKLSSTETILLYTRNLIVSPGQTIIRTKVIPSKWFKHICTINGADDYMLWLLLFSNGSRFQYLNDMQYTHRYTSMNLSINEEKMNESSDEIVELLQASGYPISKINLINKRRQWKRGFKQANPFSKMAKVLAHPKIFLYNFIYMIFWKGYKFKENDFN